MSAAEMERTREVVADFGRPGGEGEKLQTRLLERASKMDNWVCFFFLHLSPSLSLTSSHSRELSTSHGFFVVLFSMDCAQLQKFAYVQCAPSLIVCISLISLISVHNTSLPEWQFSSFSPLSCVQLAEWWQNAAYLAIRSPLFIYSNPANTYPRLPSGDMETFIRWLNLHCVAIYSTT